jgi:hypothetical protein
VITENEDKFRWSFDISNLRRREHFDDKYFILVAISRTNIDEDMKKNDTKRDYVRGYLHKEKYMYESKRTKDDTTINVSEKSESEISQLVKGTAIYCLELNKDGSSYVLNVVNSYHHDGISGICKFVVVKYKYSPECKNNDISSSSSSSLDNVKRKRFIVLNFNGIYNFKLNDACDGINLI